MRQHVDLAGVLYVLWGAMVLLLSVALLSTGLAATAIGSATGQAAQPGRLAAGLVAAGFFTFSAAGFLFGGLHIWVGLRLRGLREWARAMAIVLAAADLILIPFGAALGVYALWVLLHRDARPLFGHVRTEP